MNKDPMLIGAGIMAVAGLVFLFTLESKETGLLFLASAVIIAGAILYERKKRAASRQDPEGGPEEPAAEEKAEVFSEKAVENAADLNDRFDRARYMDGDEK